LDVLQVVPRPPAYTRGVGYLLIYVRSTFSEASNVFKPSPFPLLIHPKTDRGERYPIIFKAGDDLRQDQQVIQIVTLVDNLLRKEI
jgi:phosphatidylinositol 3-kinase